MTDHPTPCSSCGTPHIAYNGRPGCAGHKSSDPTTPCGREPMEGGTVCLTHGGGAPQVRAAAERRGQERAALVALESFGLPVEVDPHTALLQDLHRTAGAVAWLGAIVADIGQADVVWGRTREKTGGDDAGTTHEAGVNTWIKLWQEERRHLVAVSSACVKAGIEERRIRVVEAQAVLLAGTVSRILDRLGLSESQRALVATVVPEELRATAELESLS